jgi:hypothetical protein
MAAPKPRTEALTGIVLGVVLIAGWLTISAGRRHAATVPIPDKPVAPVSAPLQPPAAAPAPTPSPAPLPESAPAPLDAMTRFRRCRSYDQYQLDTHSASVGATQLLEEASCLCSLAGGYTVRVANGGLQVYKAVAACPAGSAPMPLGPDAKQWKGEWIDEPGHKECVCSTDAREMSAFVVR